MSSCPSQAQQAFPLTVSSLSLSSAPPLLSSSCPPSYGVPQMPVPTSGENFLRQVLPFLSTPSSTSTQDKCTLVLFLSPNLESPLGCHSSIAFKMPVVHPAEHSSGDLILLTANFSASSWVDFCHGLSTSLLTSRICSSLWPGFCPNHFVSQA